MRNRPVLLLVPALALLIGGPANVVSASAPPSTQAAAPSLVWSRLIGGGPINLDPAATSDPQGNVYTAGTSANAASSSDGHVAGASADSRPGAAHDDWFVAKISPSGTVAWLHDIGTPSQYQYVGGIARLTDGRIAVVGATDGSVFPGTPPGSGHAVPGLPDALVAVFAPDTGKLLWARYIGGPFTDHAAAVTAGPNGSVIVAGGITVTANSAAPDVIRDRPESVTHVKESAFLASFSREGERQWMTVLSPTRRVSAREAKAGQEDNLLFTGVAADHAGRLYVSGGTDTPYLPASPSAAQSSAVRGAGMQGFVARYSADGKRTWLSFLGGHGHTAARAVAVSPDSRRITVIGETASADFPQVSPARRGCNGRDTFGGFVATFSLDGRRILQASCYGADVTELLRVAYRRDGTLVLGGFTTDSAFPLVRALAGPQSPKQGVVVTLDPLGRVHASSRLGGSVVDELTGLTVVPGGDIVASGYTCSPDFPGQQNAPPLDQPAVVDGGCTRDSAFVTRLHGF